LTKNLLKGTISFMSEEEAPSRARKSGSSRGSVYEKIAPILIFLSIGLAFGVGVLWQKVKSLEGTKTAVAPSGNTGQVAAASALSDLPALVESIGIDKGKFQECVDSGKYKDRVESDYQEGITAGVQGTPGNFLVNKKGEVWFVPGAYPYENIKPIIELALGRTSDAAATQGIEKLSNDQAAKLPGLKDQDHVRGKKDAQVLLIEYSDFQCPYCQRFHSTTLQILKDYANEVGFVYRHFPLDQLHPYARPAAEASECIKEIGGEDAFWKFADMAFGTS
jgi:protein-disulfide isomerase